MPNIASLLKEEISRQARKELRRETDALKKTSSRHRSEIAALKRRLADLERLCAQMQKRAANTAADAPAPDAAPKARFSAAGLKKLRERLDLSAAALAVLLEVSLQTIYNWESGATRPRPDQIGKIAALRKTGKREVQARLAAQA